MQNLLTINYEQTLNNKLNNMDTGACVQLHKKDDSQ